MYVENLDGLYFYIGVFVIYWSERFMIVQSIWKYISYNMSVSIFCKIRVIVLVPVGVWIDKYGFGKWICFCCKSGHMYGLGYK
jgi:hypothetical protein